MKRTLRQLTIDDSMYLWRRRHVHMETYKHEPCVEVLTVYLEGYKRSPLRLRLPQDEAIAHKDPQSGDHWLVGYPQDGVVWRGKDAFCINLNRPGVVAAIVRYARQHGWDPLRQRSPFLVQDFTWLESIDFPPEQDS